MVKHGQSRGITNNKRYTIDIDTNSIEGIGITV